MAEQAAQLDKLLEQLRAARRESAYYQEQLAAAAHAKAAAKTCDAPSVLTRAAKVTAAKCAAVSTAAQDAAIGAGHTLEQAAAAAKAAADGYIDALQVPTLLKRENTT